MPNIFNSIQKTIGASDEEMMKALGISKDSLLRYSGRAKDLRIPNAYIIREFRDYAREKNMKIDADFILDRLPIKN